MVLERRDELSFQDLFQLIPEEGLSLDSSYSLSKDADKYSWNIFISCHGISIGYISSLSFGVYREDLIKLHCFKNEVSLSDSDEVLESRQQLMLLQSKQDFVDWCAREFGF